MFERKREGEESTGCLEDRNSGGGAVGERRGKKNSSLSFCPEDAVCFTMQVLLRTIENYTISFLPKIIFLLSR